MNKANQFLLSTGLLLSIGYASIATVACPAVDSLQYNSIGDQHYSVSGQSDVLSGGMPEFLLSGKSAISKAEQFQSLTYERRNQNGQSEVICQYSGKNKQGKEVSFSIKAINAEWTNWCMVKGYADNHCEGNRLGCILSCEMLYPAT